MQPNGASCGAAARSRQPRGGAYAPGSVASSLAKPWKHKSTLSHCAYSRNKLRTDDISESPCTWRTAASIPGALTGLIARADFEIAACKLRLQLLEPRHRRCGRIAYDQRGLLHGLRPWSNFGGGDALRLKCSEPCLRGLFAAKRAQRNSK